MMDIRQLLEVEYPVIQGGMARVSMSPLVAAVSEAGGLGVIGGAGMPPEDLREEIKKTKKLTDKPFGVNLMLQMGYIEEQIKVVVEEKVPVITVGAGNPVPYISALKPYGIKVIPVVASANLAIRAVRGGAPAIIVEGKESGGHIGKVCTIPLLMAVLKAVGDKVPVIAAGGIADGKTARAMKLLGASGVQVGTRFVATEEAPVHPNYKKLITKATERSTVEVGNRFRHGLRMFRNKLARLLIEAEMAGDEEKFSELARGKLKLAVHSGDVDMGMFLMGQIAGIIDSIVPAGDVVREIGTALIDT